jgi:phage tail-like protein
MARPSKSDPIERFRFKVTVFEFNPAITKAKLTAPNAIAYDETIFAGFSEVVIPRVRVSELNYRENIDPIRFRKSPGLARYDPIILRKGVVDVDRGFYNWYIDVNNDANSITMINDLLSANNVIATYPITFRRDVVIESINRRGETVRAWVIVNAFPIEYKGGNDLDALSEEKLIEEIVLTYEAFVEIPSGDLQDALAESQRASEKALTSALWALGTTGGSGFL